MSPSDEKVNIGTTQNRFNGIRFGAGERNRTPDRLITSQLLYLLSYASSEA
jgi:hypothetical protein